MAKYENKVLDIIEALHKSGLLKNCIVSGSWAMLFYKEIFEGFIPPILQQTLISFFQTSLKSKKAILTNYKLI